MKLSADKRKKIAASLFALPDKRFPLTDKSHDRMAISGATRSFDAGNISESQEDAIKAKARAKLKK
jgi:hypothetical protein